MVLARAHDSRDDRFRGRFFDFTGWVEVNDAVLWWRALREIGSYFACASIIPGERRDAANLANLSFSQGENHREVLFYRG